jgi:hypothetical protein
VARHRAALPPRRARHHDQPVLRHSEPPLRRRFSRPKGCGRGRR